MDNGEEPSGRTEMLFVVSRRAGRYITASGNKGKRGRLGSIEIKSIWIF
jgi:hypothetical protein